MARRLNRLVSIVLSAALVVLSSGLDAQQAFAQTVSGRAAPVSAPPQLGLGINAAPVPSLSAPAMSLTAPSLSAPSVLTPSPSLAAPVAASPAALKPAAPAAAIAEKVLAAAPALSALAKPETGGSAAADAGRELENVLTGARTAKHSDSSGAVAAGVPSALTPSLSAPAAAPDAPKAAVPAAAPAPATPKTVESASSYYAHRMALKAIAAATGAIFSLPQAGAALTAKIIASAADKRLVVSDFDDTLAGYNAVLPAEKVEAIRAIRAAGKYFAVVSDRSDEKRPGSTQLTVFESLASLPADVAEGMYVAANSGGKLYRYQGGVPVKIWEAEPLAAEKLEAVKEASAATVERLHEAGVEQHPGDSLNPKESYSTYGYALMIKVGATPAQMKQVAAIMSEELAKRGIEVEVMGRLPKDPKNPGYATFSVITKSPATAKIAELLGLSASEALVIGDMMYVPRAAKRESWLTRLGLKLSGLPIGETGNETDRNMSKGLPGVLALGVGHKMDPRIPNGWNLAGHGPEVTQKVLEAVASKPASPGNGSKSALKALEAKYAADLGKLPGVSKVMVEDSTFFYGGTLNDTRGKDIRVVFSGVPEMQAGRASLPETLPAIDGIKAVARYNVVAEVEKSAQREAYRALEAKYAADLGKLPGVSKVKVEDSTFFYGGTLNDTRGKDIRVVFSGVAQMQAGRASLPETLPAIDGIKAVARYNVVAEVEKSAQREAYRALEAKYAADLGKLPGVSKVKVEDSTFFYGGTLNDTEGKVIRVIFADVAAMQAGRSALPATLPAIDGIKAVARYKVVAEVSENGGDKVGTAIQLGLIGMIVGLGALGWYAFASALGDIVRLGEEAVRNWQNSPFGQDAGFFLGATALGVAGMLGRSSAAKPAGLTHAVEPNDLYALALEKISAQAAAAGVSADKIKFLSAVHQSRRFNGAWIGDEWRFHFGWGGENGGVEYMVPARRTMVSETMMDAFEPELKGLASKERLADGVGAAYFDMGVKLGPDAALKGLDGVSRVSLLPRVEPVSGDKDLWYSYQDSRDELASMNARTGEIRKAAPAAPKDSALKSFLMWLGGVALVAAIYGGFYWAASHAPVASPQMPEGWSGPIPTIDDVFRGMGGVLGLGMLAGTLRAKKAKVTDDEIAAAAKSVVASKGGVWSQTEYNMGYYTTLESLKARGATKKQIALYEKLCAEAPVIGGRFNPWSGD